MTSRLQPGSSFGGFEILAVLGSGAMGVVYRARDGELNRDVALKIPTSAGDGARFQREAIATAALDHPGIVRIYSQGEEQGTPYIAYELVEGATTLEEVAPTLDQDGRVRLLRDAALAMGHAHGRGVVHRDLKPDNLLVDTAGRLRVADFGLGHVANVEALTKTGTLVGTPLTMSPEQIAGDRSAIGPPTDVWGLGATLYWALTGEFPFLAGSVLELAGMVTSVTPLKPSALTPEAGPYLDAITLKALRKSPTDRYADGDALAADLDRYLSGLPPEGVVLLRRRILVLVLALGGLLALCALGYSTLSSRGPEVTAPTSAPQGGDSDLRSRYKAALLLAVTGKKHSAKRELEVIARSNTPLGDEVRRLELVQASSACADALSLADEPWSRYESLREILGSTLSASTEAEPLCDLAFRRLIKAGDWPGVLKLQRARLPLGPRAFVRQAASETHHLRRSRDVPLALALDLPISGRELFESLEIEERWSRYPSGSATPPFLALLRRTEATRVRYLLSPFSDRSLSEAQGRTLLELASRVEEASIRDIGLRYVLETRLLQIRVELAIGEARPSDLLERASKLSQAAAGQEGYGPLVVSLAETERQLLSRMPDPSPERILGLWRRAEFATRGQDAHTAVVIGYMRDLALFSKWDEIHSFLSEDGAATELAEARRVESYLRLAAAEASLPASPSRVLDHLRRYSWLFVSGDPNGGGRKLGFNSTKLELGWANYFGAQAHLLLGEVKQARQAFDRVGGGGIWHGGLQRLVRREERFLSLPPLSAVTAYRLRFLAEEDPARAPQAIHDVGGHFARAGESREAFSWYERAAALGLPEATHSVGKALRDGLGVKQNHGKAVACFRAAAAQDEREAMCSLAAALRAGRGVEKNEKKALAWWVRAAKLGSPRAQYELGRIYNLGQGVAKDPAKATGLYRQAAQGGSPFGMAAFGLQLASGAGVKQDEVAGFSWIRKSAAQGNTWGMSLLALQLTNGRGTAQDLVKGTEWYRKAAELGHVSSMEHLGRAYEDGRGVAKDPRQAANWYQKASKRGSTSGLNSLGRVLAFVLTEPKGWAMAASCFSRGASQGDARSMYNLGRLYSLGRGVSKDEALGTQWIRRAAEAGDTTAMVEVGIAFEAGEAPNWVKAADSYRRAAEGGQCAGMVRWAACLEFGRGVPADNDLALKWLTRAEQEATLEENRQAAKAALKRFRN
ncbi:MAG: SEL1-like repeat protein [Planctomycetes bacterium]|nr:SEL1-like repeat protein [Planctomycetota bacterium]